jgi:hypothetical protein
MAASSEAVITSGMSVFAFWLVASTNRRLGAAMRGLALPCIADEVSGQNRVVNPEQGILHLQTGFSIIPRQWGGDYGRRV